jgi:hypothetical protein
MDDRKNNNEKEDKEDYLNSPEKFHFQMPLYKEFDLSDEQVADKIQNNLNNEAPIDIYCVGCKKETVFHRADDNFYGSREESEDVFEILYYCTREAKHKYRVFYIKDGHNFKKIGQNPSVADLQIPQVKKYRKILGGDKFQEFEKAIMLASNGVGVGSFVYLRRTFEKLIEGARQDAKKDGIEIGSDRIEEKIKCLENYLPQVLVEKRQIYSVLSKGIHELDEQECLSYFNPLKIGIEIILDEKLESKKKEKRRKEFDKAFNKISEGMNKGSNFNENKE